MQRLFLSCRKKEILSVLGWAVVSGELVPRSAGAWGQCLVHFGGQARVTVSGVAVVAAPMMQVCIGGGQVRYVNDLMGMVG